jgi:hypothetical protein
MFICFGSRRRDRVESRVVLPLPEEPIIAQKPPIIEPDTSSRRILGGLDLVETVKFLKFRTTGALSGAIGE